MPNFQRRLPMYSQNRSCKTPNQKPIISSSQSRFTRSYLGRRKLRVILPTIAIADRELESTVSPVTIIDPKICGLWRALIDTCSQDEAYRVSVRHALSGDCAVRVYRARFLVDQRRVQVRNMKQNHAGTLIETPLIPPEAIFGT